MCNPIHHALNSVVSGLSLTLLALTFAPAAVQAAAQAETACETFKEQREIIDARESSLI